MKLIPSCRFDFFSISLTFISEKHPLRSHFFLNFGLENIGQRVNLLLLWFDWNIGPHSIDGKIQLIRNRRFSLISRNELLRVPWSNPSWFITMLLYNPGCFQLEENESVTSTSIDSAWGIDRSSSHLFYWHTDKRMFSFCWHSKRFCPEIVIHRSRDKGASSFCCLVQ